MMGLGDALADIAELKRQLAVRTVRLGTVMAVRKGEVQVNLGIGAGGKAGDTDSKANPWKSPWIRTGQHHGFVNEHIPFFVGQTVEVTAMNGDFTQAIVKPYSYSDQNPLPKDADLKKATRRIRKPTDDPEAKRTDDDEKDHHTREDYEGAYRRKGRATTHVGEPDGGGVEQILHKLGLSKVLLSGAQGVEKLTQEILQNVEGQAKSLVEQTVGGIELQVKSALGTIASMKHTVEEIGHKIGELSSTKLTATNWLSKIGEISKIEQSAAGILHSMGGNVSSFLSVNGLIQKAGSTISSITMGAVNLSSSGVSLNLSAIGSKFLGGLVNHDGIDIGKTHMHIAMTRFGPATVLSVAASIAAGFAGSSSGSNDGGGSTTPPLPPDPRDDRSPLLADNLPFATGRIKGTDGTLIGRATGVRTVTKATGLAAYTVTFEEGNGYGDAEYSVFVSSDVDQWLITVISPMQFRVEFDQTPYRLSFLVLP